MSRRRHHLHGLRRVHGLVQEGVALTRRESLFLAALFTDFMGHSTGFVVMFGDCRFYYLLLRSVFVKLPLICADEIPG